MFAIDCPWCGTRDQREFHCGGEDRSARPAAPEALDDAAWADWVFMRANEKGEVAELWQHRHGCRRWFRVVRDTATDAICAVHPIERPVAIAEPGTTFESGGAVAAGTAAEPRLREGEG